ncbi:MAG: nuclease-related domain-containing protein, partial [Nitrososphaeria archaeon]
MLFKEKNVKSKSEDRTLLDLQIERLEDELSDLADIKQFFIVLFILVVLVFAAYSLDSFFKLLGNQPGSKFWFGLSVFDIFAFIFIGGYSLKKFNKFIQKLKDERDIATKEREAEKRVQKFLEDNLTEDYHVFKNVYTGYGDIDAIVVGPTGIFVVEVKSNSGLITKNDKGYLAVIEGESPSKNYREQVIKE